MIILSKNNSATLLLSVMMFMLPLSVNAQDMKSITFNFPRNASGNAVLLTDFLQKDVRYSKECDCNSEFGFFYFKVSYPDLVDSISYHGTLSSDRSEKIIENIKETKSYWSFKKGKNNSSSKWFIYPYFDFGDDRNIKNTCTEAEKKLQDAVMIFAENIGQTELSLRRKAGVLLREKINSQREIKCY